MQVTVNVMQVTVNDEPRRLPPGATVADLVATLGLGPRRVAIEVNREIVPRATYAATVLRDGDTIEVIHFVGGG
jgi:thiamine biosynthesis protein ThiS